MAAQVAPQQAPSSMQQPRDVPLAETANQAGGATTTTTPTGEAGDAGSTATSDNKTSRAAGSQDTSISKTAGKNGPSKAELNDDSSGGGSAGGAETSDKTDGETTTGDGLGGAAPTNKSDGKGQRARGRRGGQKYRPRGGQGGGSSGTRSSNRQGGSPKKEKGSSTPRGGGGGGKSQQYQNDRRNRNHGGYNKNYQGHRGYKNSKERVLHVSAQSPVKQVAGAIAWISREGECPKILATAAPAINQAVKACAIARQFMSEDKIEVSVYPEYTRGRRRDADSFTFDLRKSVTRYQVVVDESMQELKVSKESKAPTVAGAIAGRVREGQRVILSAIGPLSVAAAVRSVAIARQYLAEDGVDISFRPSFMNIEFNDGRKSSCLNFQLLAQQV